MRGQKKIPGGPNGSLGIFFMFFANNFFLKIGNLSIETEFRCKNLTLEGNWWLANIFARQFVFLESQNVWDKTVISCKQFFKKGSHWKIFRKLLWKECFYKSPNAWNANVTKHLKLTNNRLIQLQPELPKKRKKRCFLVVFLIGTIFFFTALHVKTKYGCLSVIRLEFFISAKWRTQMRFGMRGQKKIPGGPNGPLGIFFMFFANNFFSKSRQFIKWNWVSVQKFDIWRKLAVSTSSLKAISFPGKPKCLR